MEPSFDEIDSNAMPRPDFTRNFMNGVPSSDLTDVDQSMVKYMPS